MTIIYSELGNWGRLGNQLWEIASTVGIATKLEVPVEFNHWDYEQYFNVPSRLFVDEPNGQESWHYAHNLPDSDQPWLQDYSLWKDARLLIRAMFRPSGLSLAQLDEYTWFYEIPRRVALHIRRDERVEVFAESHPTPPWAYYERAMEVIRRRIPDPTFCVFSDDIPWCKENLDGNFVFVEGYPRYQDEYQAGTSVNWKDHLDIFLMASCVGHIIPNSTFGWWGAALSRDPYPIYPAVWYGPSLDHVDWRLQIPDHWVEVDWR